MKCKMCGKRQALFGSLCEACLEKEFYSNWEVFKEYGLIEKTGGDDDLPPDKQNYRLTEKGRNTPGEDWDRIIAEAKKNREKDSEEEGEKSWMIIHILETGESAVASLNGRVQLLTYEKAKTVVGDFKPGQISYFPEGGYAFTDTIDVKMARKYPPISVLGAQAIPRSTYNPMEHDSFHLRLGSLFNDFLAEGRQAMEAAQMAADIENPGSALDVMSSLGRLMRGELIVDHQKYRQKLEQLLSQAHPILWSATMTKIARNAVIQLKESISVEKDLLFLDPTLWLYTEPQWYAGRADSLEYPLTEDGHIPLPEEFAFEGGAFTIAELFYNDGDCINLWLLSLVQQEGEWLFEAGLLKWRLGTIPQDESSQYIVKTMRFAASPYLVVQRHSPQRTVVRRAEGRYPIAVEEGIGVILLRRALFQGKSENKRTGEPVEWSCQWWVSGHWRHQPCGERLQNRKWIWLAPYIKGPSDKPIKEPVRLMVR
jgi:hypothetical protein